jgi:hypothetical protein
MLVAVQEVTTVFNYQPLSLPCLKKHFYLQSILNPKACFILVKSETVSTANMHPFLILTVLN